MVGRFECIWEFRSDGRRTVRLDYEYKGKVAVTYSHDSLIKNAPAGEEIGFVTGRPPLRIGEMDRARRILRRCFPVPKAGRTERRT